MHAEAYQFLTAHAEPASTVLDVGGRDINGSPRGLFPTAEYVALDVVAGHGVDVVADIVDWTDRRRFDVVVCAEVLEHTATWSDVVGACWKHLAAGGLLLVTCATEGRPPHSAVDGGPLRPGEFYGNVGEAELLAALKALGASITKVESHARGDLYVAAKKRARRTGGKPVVVGERGAERFVPPSNGTIIGAKTRKKAKGDG